MFRILQSIGRFVKEWFILLTLLVCAISAILINPGGENPNSGLKAIGLVIFLAWAIVTVFVAASSSEQNRSDGADQPPGP